MNIAIDISPLSSAHRYRGVGVYTESIISAFKRYRPSHTILPFSKDGVPPKADIVFYPYFDFFRVSLPLLMHKPTCVLIYDMIPIMFPEHFPRGIKGELCWQVQKRLIHSVRGVLTISKSSRDDINRLLDIPKENIYVTYLAPSENKPKPARQHRTLPKRYVLYVGDVNWNKNIFGLLRAFHEVCRVDHDICLVLVGKAFVEKDLPEAVKIRDLVKSLRLVDRVIFPGYVDEQELATLYSQASVYVQPSFYEGFGLPPLDAMRFGCPVVTADNSSLAEIAGPSIRVQAQNPESIAAGVSKVLSFSPVQRKEYVTKSIAWAKTFTWEKTVTETIAAYEKILHRN